MVSDDAFGPHRASASSAAAASAFAAAPPPSTLATESPFMASTPLAWARPSASGSRPPAPRSPAPSIACDAALASHAFDPAQPSRNPSLAYGAPMQDRCDPSLAAVNPGYGAPMQDRDRVPAQLPYGAAANSAAPPASGPRGTPVQMPYGGPYPAPYVAPSSPYVAPAPYASSSAVPYEAPYGAPYAVSVPHAASLQPYGVPPTAPYGHHQHYRTSPSADALIPYSAPPTYDSQLSASVAEPGPFHFSHLVTVKLSADNYFLWRAQVLSLMRSHYLEGYVDGTLPCPPAVVPVPSAAGGSVMVSNPAHRRWIAQDQDILGAIQSSLTPSVAGMVVFAATSRDAWATLDSSFSSQSLACSSAIRNQLGEVKKNDISVTAFFNKVKSLADTLSSIGKPLRDEEFTSFILNGLDEDYDSLVENINGRDTPMPPRDIYARLLNTEQRLAARRSVGVYTEGPSANAALRGGARGAKQKAPPTSGNQPRPPAPAPTAGLKRLHCEACGGGVECQLCGIEGHLASRCHRRFKRDFLGIGNNGKGNEKQAALATPDPGFTPSYSVDPAWYMDTGATDHLTSQLDKLATRQPYTGHDQVRTANGSGTGRGARLELLDDDMATTAPVAATPDEALDEAASATTSLDPDVDHACMPHARGSDGVTKSPGPAVSLSPGPAEPAELSAGPAGPAALSPEPEASQVTESSSPGPSTPVTPGLSSRTLTVPPDVPVDSPAGASSSSLMDSGSSGMAAAAPPPPVVLRPHTRSKSGIFQPKKRTDGTVTWLAACVAHAEADPTTEPRHF
nr:endochitinase A-like [Aegilops tauschii subsp. strangulata]